MAAYTQNITAVSIEEQLLLISNTIDRKVLKDIVDLIITEFAAMETAGLASYTVTTGLEASMVQRLDNYGDNTKVLMLEDFIGMLLVEFASVETDGLSFTQTSGWQVSMKLNVDNFPNVIDRICLHEVIGLLNAEFVLLVAAS